jgi:hypothetical protein
MNVIVQVGMVEEIVIKISAHHAIKIHVKIMERAKKIGSETTSAIVPVTILESFVRHILSHIHYVIKIHAIIMEHAEYNLMARNMNVCAKKALSVIAVRRILMIVILSHVKMAVDVQMKLEDSHVTAKILDILEIYVRKTLMNALVIHAKIMEFALIIMDHIHAIVQLDSLATTANKLSATVQIKKKVNSIFNS